MYVEQQNTSAKQASAALGLRGELVTLKPSERGRFEPGHPKAYSCSACIRARTNCSQCGDQLNWVSRGAILAILNFTRFSISLHTCT